MELFVPGRICLFGEHSDWAGGYRRDYPDIEKGYTLISGTNQGLYARATASETLILRSTMPDNTVRTVDLPMTDVMLLQEAQSGAYWAYMAGVAYQVRQRFPDVGGVMIDNYKTTLPVKKGLSSSAAVSVLTARAFNQVYDLGLDIRDEMELAYLGETTTPSQCGRMDQGCAFGVRPILMTFDGDDLDVQPVAIGAPIHLIIVDLGAAKDTPKILADLNRCYPKAETACAKGVQKLLGSINKQLIDEAIDVLQAGDAQKLGKLMCQAQAEFDRYAMPACPEQLTSPVLHRLLAYDALQSLVWGGKGVGSQGDGSAQFVAKSAETQQQAITLIETELNMTCLPLTLGNS
ncbi:MAG: mevalonate kinase family protein [Candidatus Promineifilaceae bacterium]